MKMVTVVTLCLMLMLQVNGQNPLTLGKFTAQPVLVSALQFTGYNQYDLYQAFTNFGVPPPFSWGPEQGDEERQFAATHAVFSTAYPWSLGPDDYARMFVQNPQGL